MNENIFSTLAYKKRSNQKSSNPPIRSIKWSYFFWFDLVLEARAEIQKYFRLFFGANKNFKSPFEINWPLEGLKATIESSRHVLLCIDFVPIWLPLYRLLTVVVVFVGRSLTTLKNNIFDHLLTTNNVKDLL